MDRLLEALCNHVEQLLPDGNCAILAVDRASGLMRELACGSRGPRHAELVDGLRVGEGFGPWGLAAARRELVIVEDLRSEPLAADFAERLDLIGVRSLLVIPISRPEGELLGLLALYYSGPHLPTEQELEIVRPIADLVALAIERDRSDLPAEIVADVDPLTGTLNRLRFLELVNERIAASGSRVAVICAEVDRFKPLRITLGQHAGDLLLAEVGRRMVEAAGPNGLAAQFDGDEFCLMVPVSGQPDGESPTDVVADRFRAPVLLEDGEFFLTVSLGLVYSDGSTDAYTLVREAAAAVHAARADGFGRRRLFDRDNAGQLFDRIEREVELRNAIESGELTMHYQPLLRLSDRVWDRAETLVRWRHPTRGLIGPVEFIPIAERSGLMNRLGDRVLDMVIAQAQEWSQTLPGVQLSVNISESQLSAPNFGDRLLSRLEAAGLPPATLLLEVTESAILRDVAGAQAILGQLLDAGIRTALDDFGTGYSSLSRLGELPITGVKIDRSFVAGLGSDARASAIFGAIADIVRAHGLLIIAEGIENEQALDAVVARGCHFAQGFYLCRPGPPERIAPILRAPVPESLMPAP